MGYISSTTQPANMKFLVILAMLGCACAAPTDLVAPEPVTDTEEVVAAKAAHAAAFAAAAAAAEAGTVPEVVNPEGAPAAVEDTEEVAAAKADFEASYAAAAAAAEAAPDFDLDGAVSRYTGYLSTVDGHLSPLYTNTYPLGAYGYAPLTHPLTYAHAAVAPLAYAHGPVLVG